MKWETKNRINNINQLNQTRQKNKLLKNKPIEEPKEERIEDEFGKQVDKYIELLEKCQDIELSTYQMVLSKLLYGEDTGLQEMKMRIIKESEGK